MKANGLDRRAATKKDRELLVPAPAKSQSAPQAAKEEKKYIEDVDDLDLYMKIYPEVKRRRDEAERQVKLVEAEIKRREDLKFFPREARSFSARRLLRLRSLMRSVIRNFSMPVGVKRREE